MSGAGVVVVVGGGGKFGVGSLHKLLSQQEIPEKPKSHPTGKSLEQPTST